MRIAGTKRSAIERPAAVRGRHVLAAIVLAGAIAAAYSNSFDAGFTLDAKGLVLGDPRIREATSGNLGLIFRHTYWWPTGEAGLYRPLTTLSWMFNYAVMGDADRPWGYRLVNLLLHALNVLSVYALGRAARCPWLPAMAAAGLWGVHPVLTESVTNIAGRADLLAGAAVLGGLLLYVKGAEARGGMRWAWLAGIAIVSGAGALSKESAVALAGAILLYEALFRRSALRAVVEGVAAAAIPAGLALYQRSVALAAAPAAEFPFTDNPIVGMDWWTGRITALRVIGRYVGLVAWPGRLSADYSWRQITPAAGGVLEVAIVCAALAGGVALYRWNKPAFAFACFGFLNLIPVSNLIFPIGTIMAERLLYLPSLGFVACFVCAVWAIPAKRVGPIVLGLAAVALAGRTWARNLDWRNDLTLASATVSASPDSFKAHRLMAQALFDSDPTRGNIEQVVREDEKALALLEGLPPARSRPEAYRVAGYHYLSMQNYRRSTELLLRSIAIDRAGRAAYRGQGGQTADGDSEAYLLLSIAELRSGDAAKATEAAATARTLNPLDARVYQQMADIFATERREDESAIAAAEADTVSAVEHGLWREAAELCERLLRLDGENFTIGHYLSAMANLRLGRLDMAERGAREAVRADTAQRNPRSYYALGAILAQEGKQREAADALRAFIAAAPNTPDADAANDMILTFH